MLEFSFVVILPSAFSVIQPSIWTMDYFLLKKKEFFKSFYRHMTFYFPVLVSSTAYIVLKKMYIKPHGVYYNYNKLSLSLWYLC